MTQSRRGFLKSAAAGGSRSSSRGSASTRRRRGRRSWTAAAGRAPGRARYRHRRAGRHRAEIYARDFRARDIAAGRCPNNTSVLCAAFADRVFDGVASTSCRPSCAPARRHRRGPEATASASRRATIGGRYRSARGRRPVSASRSRCCSATILHAAARTTAPPLCAGRDPRRQRGALPTPSSYRPETSIIHVITFDGKQPYAAREVRADDRRTGASHRARQAQRGPAMQ